MKKRILMLILVLPIIVVFIAFGIANFVELPTNLVIEKIVTNYSEMEELIYDEDDLFLLECIVFPSVIKNPKIIWEIVDIEEIESGEGVAAKIIEIDGKEYLQGFRDCYVSLRASSSDGNVKSSLVNILVTTSSSEAKKIIINQRNNESGITDEYFYGLFDVNSQGELVMASINLNPRLIPLRCPQEYQITVTSGHAVVNDDVLTFLTAGEVSIEVSSLNNPLLKVEYTYHVRDGINVKNYEQLIMVTNEDFQKALVLQCNLESMSNLKTLLGYDQSVVLKDYDYENLSKRGYQLCGMLNGNDVTLSYSLIKSTYDLRFYEYRQIEAPLLKVGVTFNEDVYGNGYTINLHELAYPSSTAGNTSEPMYTTSDPFQGPLEFISAYGMTVYGQDNIGFLVNGDNITLHNIILMNCNTTNLSYLNYVGTTLEIMGDNVTIKGCIIQNGRTVVRSFSNENLVIDSSLLKYGREFILKIGSNQIIRSYFDENNQFILAPTPMLNGQLLSDSSCLVKNSYFFSSGFFAIGIDTHFSGELLYDAKGHGLPDLHLSGTSYATRLTIEGDCLFYEWKELDRIDASTLISGVTSNDFFNFAAMVRSMDLNDTSIIKALNDKNQLVDYVHGGIVLFGGGQNYSTITFLDHSDDFNYYSIKISDVNDGIATSLVKAAGDYPFRFYTYRNTIEKVGINDTPHPSALALYYKKEG